MPRGMQISPSLLQLEGLRIPESDRRIVPDGDKGFAIRKDDLVDQLMPYQTGSVADEAQRWLDRHS